MTDTTWPPPWTLKPAHSDPEIIREYGEDEQPLPEFVHWAIGWGFALNAGPCDHEDDHSPLTISAHFGDDDLARGFVKREVSPAQLREFARLLLNVAAAHEQRTAVA
ncbi:hypothetical protein AMIS_21210 [Actinoplanes missouriensis 431]|uniref:Uncharacterized protein n=1 Tax=Actinoplanes missouriensis (strain ATCC 14538 / DSM 43046 / CBS 188.64 / JCM 3121 / NBRC 102363 / NCIMB 12654 / NRRL B-3342 / UNCC 431) TaxID=512565 RepID=I0H2V4_ACTM4|nr:hypothetical protein [Actinoplanes missouriensis]BAL87341.1 hypothetical protein AMIS_21210 [Actinoplanes missouriensis 431]